MGARTKLKYCAIGLSYLSLKKQFRNKLKV